MNRKLSLILALPLLLVACAQPPALRLEPLTQTDCPNWDNMQAWTWLGPDEAGGFWRYMVDQVAGGGNYMPQSNPKVQYYGSNSRAVGPCYEDGPFQAPPRPVLYFNYFVAGQGRPENQGMWLAAWDSNGQSRCFQTSPYAIPLPGGAFPGGWTEIDFGWCSFLASLYGTNQKNIYWGW